MQIANEIGRIFKGHNIIEYKSPDDGLTIDDFFKAAAHACLYKSLGQTVDQYPAEDITVSLFREAYPRERTYVKQFLISSRKHMIREDKSKETTRCGRRSARIQQKRNSSG